MKESNLSKLIYWRLCY